MYVKQTWVDNSSIANAERLNHMEDGIYDGNLDIYSTTEQVVGTWIDNKPIYRKIIQATSPSEESTIAAQIASLQGTPINKIIKFDGYIYYNNNTWRGVNSYQTSLLFSFSDVNYNGSYWIIRQCCTGANYLSKSEYFILEYTKTTD